MKQALVLLALTISLTGCGLAESVNSNCGGDSRAFCDGIFGTKDANQDESISKNVRNIKDVNARVVALELQYSDLRNQVDTLTLIQTSNTTTLTGLINNAQANANTALASIAALQAEMRIVEVVDPCGDTAGFDEVLMRTSTGQLIAYFESGSTRFLTILAPGSYQTTDSSACPFTVNASNQMCDAISCR